MTIEEHWQMLRRVEVLCAVNRNILSTTPRYAGRFEGEGPPLLIFHLPEYRPTPATFPVMRRLARAWGKLVGGQAPRD